MISFGPFTIYNIMRAFKLLTSIPNDQCEAIDTLIRALPWLSPVLNPLIYSFSGSNFRQYVASLFGWTLSPDVRRIIHRSAVLSSASINPSKLSVSMRSVSVDSSKSSHTTKSLFLGSQSGPQSSSSTLYSSLLLPQSPK